MTPVTVVPRPVPLRSPRRSDAVRKWLAQDHPVPHTVLVPAGLAGLTGLFLLSFALLLHG